MIDNFAVLISHVLLALAFWRLVARDDVDVEAPPPPAPPQAGFGRTRSGSVPSPQPPAGRGDA